MNPPIDMTLRDYFAAKAAQTFVQGASADNFDALAVDAYKLADSMLKARDTPQAQPAREPLTDEQIDKAAMKLAECMDYPWAQMPEQGKRSMRSHAKAVIESSGITKGNT